MNRQTQIVTFKAIAARNYDKSMGWSTFTECYDNNDIVDFFTFDHLDSEKAIEAAMADIASVWDDRHADAKNNAF